MTAAAVKERSPLQASTPPPSASPSFPLADRRRVVPADDPCAAGLPGADPEYAGIYLHARYYDPQIGTFLSADRLHPGRPGVGVNRYAYGLGNPVNLTDRGGFEVNVCTGDEENGNCHVLYFDSVTVNDKAPPFYPNLVDQLRLLSAFAELMLGDLRESRELGLADGRAGLPTGPVNTGPQDPGEDECTGEGCDTEDPPTDPPQDPKKPGGKKAFTYEKDGQTHIFYEGRPSCGDFADHYGRNWNVTNQWLHDTGVGAAKFVVSGVWAAAEGYPALALFLTGAGGAVAGHHYLGVAATKAGAHAAVSVFGFYGGLGAGTAVVAARDYFGNCNP